MLVVVVLVVEVVVVVVALVVVGGSSMVRAVGTVATEGRAFVVIVVFARWC